MVLPSHMDCRHKSCNGRTTASLRDSYLRLHELLREQAGVRRERRKITRTKMKLSKRPGFLQRHHRQAKTPQIFCGRLR